jgi:hypothetical protein
VKTFIKILLNQTQCKFVLSTFVINADMCYLLSAELSIPNLESLSFLYHVILIPLYVSYLVPLKIQILLSNLEFILFFMVVI